MNFESLNDLLDAHALTVPHLPMLHPDENNYRCLSMQPEAEVSASPSGVSVPNLDDRCNAFWDLALTADVDLALTPEYSFSWAVLEAKVSSGAFPARGKLWVLGMQSITPAELDALADRVEPARIIYDRPWEHSQHGTFLDPACFILTSVEDVPVIVVQFKQSQMGTQPEPIERNHMIHGRHGYFVQDGPTSIRLACVICADALNFSPISDLPDFPGRSYLLVHLQLNPHPRHPDFAAYRRAIFGRKPDYVEILCLNWAATTTISLPSSKPIRFGFPQSGMYWKELQVSPGDHEILTNHSGAAYYFYWRPSRAHMHVMHDAEHCLLFDATKPSQDFGPGPSSTRSGMQSPSALVWGNGVWAQRPLDDGCASLIQGTTLPTQNLLNSLDRLELERFVALCCGDVDGEQWAAPTALPAFCLSTDEEHKRVGFCRDPESHPQAITKLSRVSTLVSQFQSGLSVTAKHAPLLRGTTIGHSSTKRACNIHRDNGPYATAAYIGDDLGGSQAERIKNALRKIFPKESNPLIFVWYSENGAFDYTTTAGQADIASGPTQPASIV